MKKNADCGVCGQKREKSAPEKNAGKCCLCYWRGVLFWQDSFSCFNQNSYTGKVKKGYRLLAAPNMRNALTVFEKAASGSPKKAEAYTGISKVYIAKDDLDQAEEVFTDEIAKQSGNAEIYRAAVEFYIDTKQEEKVSPLLNACTSDTVLEALKGLCVR